MNTELFLQVLPYIGKGMLGIFVVTFVLIGCIALLNKLTALSDSKKKNDKT